MFEESILLGKGLATVCAFKDAIARFAPVSHERPRRGETAAALFAYDVRLTLVTLHVIFTGLQRCEYKLAQVTLVKLILKVSR